MISHLTPLPPCFPANEPSKPGSLRVDFLRYSVPAVGHATNTGRKAGRSAEVQHILLWSALRQEGRAWGGGKQGLHRGRQDRGDSGASTSAPVSLTQVSGWKEVVGIGDRMGTLLL